MTNENHPTSTVTKDTSKIRRNWDGGALPLLCRLSELIGSDCNLKTLNTLTDLFHDNGETRNFKPPTNDALLRYSLIETINGRLPDFRKREIRNLICLLSNNSVASPSAGNSREVRCSFPPYEAHSIESLLEMELSEERTIHYDFIVHLIDGIVNRESTVLKRVLEYAARSQPTTLEKDTPPEKAGILIFMPGWASMMKLRNRIKKHPSLQQGKVKTVLCHGELDSHARKEIFSS